MDPTNDDFRRVALSLDAIPERDRLAIFREVIGRQMVRWDLAPSPGAALHAELEWAAMPGLEAIWGDIGAVEIRRTPEMIADGNDGFSFSIATHGSWRMATRGREIDDGGSVAGLMSLAEPSLVVSPARAGFIVLQIPRAALAARLARVDDATLAPIAVDSPSLALLRGYLALIRSQKDLSTPALRQAVARHVHDLVALSIGGARDAAAMAGGVAAASLDAIKSDIECNLRHPDLCVDLVAAWRGVSPRQVQRLFERAGETFSAFVLARRLALAHAQLSDPRRGGRSVAEIAFDCRFGDLSHFNRAFRRLYGATPSDVREAALGRSGR